MSWHLTVLCQAVTALISAQVHSQHVVYMLLPLAADRLTPDPDMAQGRHQDAGAVASSDWGIVAAV